MRLVTLCHFDAKARNLYVGSESIHHRIHNNRGKLIYRLPRLSGIDILN